MNKMTSKKSNQAGKGGLKIESEDPNLAKNGSNDAAQKGSEMEEVTKAQDELQQQKDKYLYLLADFDNYKKRAIKERSELMKYGNLELVRSMLKVVDNFELILEAALKASTKSEGLVEGAELAIKQFHDGLAKWGIVPVDCVGTPFDPFLHEAIGCEIMKDKDANIVVKELQKAYKIHDKILRPAKVIISSQGIEKGESEGE